jgi:hypothetical protein
VSPYLPQDVAISSPEYSHAFLSRLLAVLFTGTLLLITFPDYKCFGLADISWN